MNLHDKLAPTHTALIIIDMQNDFCSPEGLMGRMGKNISDMPNLVLRIKQMIDVCDKVHVPVFYTQQIYDRTKLNDLQKEQYDIDGKLITCDIDGDGWLLYGFDPPKEQVYPKYNYNIFSNDKLQKDLSAKHIKTLIITGVSTQICVETAIRNGFDLGYKIIVPTDLIATTSSDLATTERTLNVVRKTYGVVCGMAEITSILLDSSIPKKEKVANVK